MPSGRTHGCSMPCKRTHGCASAFDFVAKREFKAQAHVNNTALWIRSPQEVRVALKVVAYYEEALH